MFNLIGYDTYKAIDFSDGKNADLLKILNKQYFGMSLDKPTDVPTNHTAVAERMDSVPYEGRNENYGYGAGKIIEETMMPNQDIEDTLDKLHQREIQLTAVIEAALRTPEVYADEIHLALELRDDVNKMIIALGGE